MTAHLQLIEPKVELAELMPMIIDAFNSVDLNGSEEAQREMTLGNVRELALRDGRKSFRLLVVEVTEGFAFINLGVRPGENELERFGINPDRHGKGLSLLLWNLVEARYPEVKVWVTGTPAVAVKNIHFCVNKCGFKIVEFFHASHRPTLVRSGGFEKFLEKGG